ncbi:MAG: hypothetical protein CVV05_00970 [Gammaproteobacteria bacterium HGW-Gammaproteobacteria-1]|jgi:hypothetical protein|nr:MAG: hypothetical protein CVV05_00970 [Gammaproteobacteria bacterium HGW-Gammaproteobacteria-1]
MCTQKMTTLTLEGARDVTGRFLTALARNIDQGSKAPEQAALLAAISNVATTDTTATLVIAHPQSPILATRLAEMARKQGLSAATTGPMEFYQLQVKETANATRATPFLCLAENETHARRQAEETYPGCTILSATPMSETMESKAESARLWLATVGHEEAIAPPDAHLFWQATKPTEAEVLARYEDVFVGQTTGLEVEAVLDISRALEFTPENAEALEACQTNLLWQKTGRHLYVVTGRLPPDDEVTTRAIETESEELARLAFEADLYEERQDTVSRPEIIAEWGESVVFNQVFELTPATVMKAAPEARLLASLEPQPKPTDPAPSL